MTITTLMNIIIIVSKKYMQRKSFLNIYNYISEYSKKNYAIMIDISISTDIFVFKYFFYSDTCWV